MMYVPLSVALICLDEAGAMLVGPSLTSRWTSAFNDSLYASVDWVAFVTLVAYAMILQECQ